MKPRGCPSDLSMSVYNLGGGLALQSIMQPSCTALVLLFAVFQTVVVVNSSPNGIYIGSKGPERDATNPQFDITVNVGSSNDKQCTKEIIVSGKGIKDTFYLPCKNDNNNNGMSGSFSLANKKYAIFIGDQQEISLFTDSPSNLVIIKNDFCTKRTYETSGQETTYTESDMSQSECDKAKAQMQEVREQWKKEFDEKMKNAFPPCFPFCDSKNPAEDVQSQIAETNKKSQEYWNDWNKKFESEIKEAFPPCFPFCKSKNPADNGKNGAEDIYSQITETDKTTQEYWKQWNEKLEAKLKKDFPPCFPFCNDNKEGYEKAKQSNV